jgi:hypothetical protein
MMVLRLTILSSKTTATVASNVLLANGAFMHAVKCFGALQTIMGQCGLLPSDFAVEVGFVEEFRERMQGVYLYCRNQLDEKIQASLVKLFHPFPYTILPLPDGKISSVGDTDVNHSSPPQDTERGQDKGKQRAGQSSLGNQGGGKNSEGNSGRDGQDQGGSGDDTGGSGNDGRGGSRGEPPSGPPGGREGQDGQSHKLCGDFESTAICSITEPRRTEIQSFRTRANIEIEVIANVMLFRMVAD